MNGNRHHLCVILLVLKLTVLACAIGTRYQVIQISSEPERYVLNLKHPVAICGSLENVQEENVFFFFSRNSGELKLLLVMRLQELYKEFSDVLVHWGTLLLKLLCTNIC